MAVNEKKPSGGMGFLESYRLTRLLGTSAVLLVCLVAGLVSGIYPAWRIASVAPSSSCAMRSSV